MMMLALCCSWAWAVSLPGGMCGPSAKITSSTPITESTTQTAPTRRRSGTGSVVSVVIAVPGQATLR